MINGLKERESEPLDFERELDRRNHEYYFSGLLNSNAAEQHYYEDRVADDRADYCLSSEERFPD